MGIIRADLITHSQLTSANASVLFDGGDGNVGTTGLKTADSGNKYVVQGDKSELTIECWIYCTNITNTFDTIWATNNYGVSGNSANFYQHYDGVYFTVSGLASDLDIRGLFELNKWHHVATTRQWSPSKSTHQWRIYVDGEIVGYAETSNSITEGVLCIGANNYGSAFPAYEFAGYISNFRMCKRVLYKEKFTPSKFKLKDVSGTVLLCCQDASDDTAVTVGDTLTAGGSPTPGGFGPDLKEDNNDVGPTFADNTKFDTLSYMVPPGGTTAERGRGRGLFAGAGPSFSKEINYIQIQSQGNTTKFGDLTTALADVQGGSSSTRGLFGAGGGSGSPGFVNTIEYVTIATTANATDFGDLNETTFQGAALANDTRYVYGGGTTPTVKDVMDYVTISTAGNATDFGNLTVGRFALTAFSSPTRGIYAGGATPTIVNTIDYITIASAGNATDFGDVTSEDTRNAMGASSSTRGVIAGGQTNAPSTGTDAIDFLTIATTGNTTDFGNLTDGRRRGSGLSNSIRGVFTGGYDPAVKNTIDYITIATIGNATDFGDYSGASIGRLGTSASDSHGGIS